MTRGSPPSKNDTHSPAGRCVFGVEFFRRGVHVLGWAVPSETASTLAGGCGDEPWPGSEACRAGRAASGGHDFATRSQSPCSPPSWSAASSPRRRRCGWSLCSASRSGPPTSSSWTAARACPGASSTCLTRSSPAAASPLPNTCGRGESSLPGPAAQQDEAGRAEDHAGDQQVGQALDDGAGEPERDGRVFGGVAARRASRYLAAGPPARRAPTTCLWAWSPAVCNVTRDQYPTCATTSATGNSRCGPPRSGSCRSWTPLSSRR